MGPVRYCTYLVNYLVLIRCLSPNPKSGHIHIVLDHCIIVQYHYFVVLALQVHVFTTYCNQPHVTIWFSPVRSPTITRQPVSLITQFWSLLFPLLCIPGIRFLPDSTRLTVQSNSLHLLTASNFLAFPSSTRNLSSPESSSSEYLQIQLYCDLSHINKFFAESSTLALSAGLLQIHQ